MCVSCPYSDQGVWKIENKEAYLEIRLGEEGMEKSGTFCPLLKDTVLDLNKALE